MKKIWIWIVKGFGWKFNIPSLAERPEIKHCVVAVAPHTAVADFFVGAAVLFAAGVHFRIFMKKEFFNFITTPLLKRMGVVPVDRGNVKNHLVPRAVGELKAHDDLCVVLTPEATRKEVKRFKRGFYEIAVGAGVPIVLAYMDFGKKEAGYGPTFMPTGDYDKDFEQMIAFYAPIQAKHPEGWHWGKRMQTKQTD